MLTVKLTRGEATALAEYSRHQNVNMEDLSSGATALDNALAEAEGVEAGETEAARSREAGAAI